MIESILGIDPGPKYTAFALYQPQLDQIPQMGIIENQTFRENQLKSIKQGHNTPNSHCTLALEAPYCFGQPLVEEIGQTILSAGRILEAWNWSGNDYSLVSRREIKHHLTGKTNTKDKHVQFALRVRFRENINSRIKPTGLLKGVHDDIWAALAVAVTYADLYLKIARPAVWRK